MDSPAQIHRPPSWRLPALAAIAVAAVLAAWLVLADERAVAQPSAAGKGSPQQPNIVLIMTDDQPAGTVIPEAMPNLFELMIGPGTSFSDYILTTPLCCPSRATTITGQYGHNNGVLRNHYSDLVKKKNVLPKWLQRAGYKTAHVGKFLNNYESFPESPKKVAPGWDLWFTQLEKRRFYNWKASKNGKKKTYGSADSDHLTDVTSKRARTWAAKLARKPEPFYMQLDYYAPHGAEGRDETCVGGPVPSPRDVGAFATTPVPQPPSFNEADVSDKPEFIQSRPLMDPETIAKTTRRWRCTIESMLGVDRGIKKVFRKVERAGELDRTVFIFTSDNGYFFGEHRIPKGKAHPYEENLSVPLTLLVPPAYRGSTPVPDTVDAPVANVDLAPTILDLAGAAPCRFEKRCRTLDGRSLLPLIDGSGGWPSERAFLVELNDCNYRGLRLDRQIYFEHGSGPLPTTGNCRPTDVEHYDLDSDPFQLDNLYPAPRRSPDGRLQLELVRRMDTLRECAGIAGRDPTPESGVFCE